MRAGEVRIGQDGPVALRPSQLVEPDASLIVDEGPRYVSRGGTKLENALEALGIDVAGRDCLDVGASTGGFTDCLLQRGAARVAAVDVAYGQLDVRMRQDPRVHVIERLNARSWSRPDLPFAPSLATIDVSFISLTKVLPAVARCLEPGGESWRWSSRSSSSAGSGSAAASSATPPTAARRSSRSPARRRSWACRCAALPPPACPARRGTARPSSGAAAVGREVEDLEAAVAAVEGDE